MPTVGSVIRAQHPDQPWQRRAVVATAPDGATVDVLWDDEAPRNVQNDLSTFMVVPVFTKAAVATESTVNVSNISELLEFERATLISTDPKVWKASGDALLTLKDPSAAASYYEAALHYCAKIQIGSTVLIRKSGRAVRAEVDCLEEDSVELTVVDTQQECICKQTEILLCIREPDPERLQERILLNVSRCLIQLADQTTTLKRRPRYLKAAVLGCTLALETARFHQNDETQITALLLRSKAQEKLCKFNHAIADIQHLLQKNHPRATATLRHLQREKQRHAQTDKKLVKDVSRWVQSVMNEERNDEAAVSSDEEEEEEEHERNGAVVADNPSSRQHVYPKWMLAFLIVLFAWFWQKQL